MRKKGLFSKIYLLVSRIPAGKVATYGQIARCLGIGDARIVGWALHANKNKRIPCHRVVNYQGELASGYVFGGWRRQRQKLLDEGVCFRGRRVDLSQSLIDESILLQRLEPEKCRG